MKTIKWQEIKWSDDLAVEIVDIDADHKHLIAHLDRLFTACHEGQEADLIKHHLLTLYGYTHRHFAHEEDVMRKCRFPEVEEHRALHAELISELDDLIEAFDTEPAFELSEKTLSFLQGWLLQHILVDDKKIGHHIGMVY